KFSKRKRTPEEQFEICIGAILTQSTSWKNVEKALLALKTSGLLNKEKLQSVNLAKLARTIKPAGYFNQKAKKIKSFVKYKGKITREELLIIWGCGPETVDSILLYAYNKPVFVIDAYTKRIMSRLGLCDKNISYEELQDMFHKNLRKDYYLFNEFHALFVEHAKQYCRTKPVCADCQLKNMCKKIL
ncbi:MAG: hypothetical protein KKA79_08910, partial [Nanoarchaeota archaeon]|nr:hypothetical protein [Nanoarchaeota archaeon]